MDIYILLEISLSWTIPMAFSGELDFGIFVDSSNITLIVFISTLS